MPEMKSTISQPRTSVDWSYMIEAGTCHNCKKGKRDVFVKETRPGYLKITCRTCFKKLRMKF